MMSIFSYIPLDSKYQSAIIVPCYSTMLSPNYCVTLQLIHDDPIGSSSIALQKKTKNQYFDTNTCELYK